MALTFSRQVMSRRRYRRAESPSAHQTVPSRHRALPRSLSFSILSNPERSAKMSTADSLLLQCRRRDSGCWPSLVCCGVPPWLFLAGFAYPGLRCCRSCSAPAPLQPLSADVA
jgi:hypothetical protein